MVNTLTLPTAALREILQTQGLVPGLQFLDQRVAHRCTVISHLSNMTLRNIYLYDKQHASLPDSLKATPLTDSFGQHAIRDGAFLTSDSNAEACLDDNPFGGVVMASHGVPVLDHAGALFGSFCYFDHISQPFPDEELAFLQKAAQHFSPYLRPTAT